MGQELVRQREADAETTGLGQRVGDVCRQVQEVLDLIDVDHDRVAPRRRDTAAAEDGLPELGDDEGADQCGRLWTDADPLYIRARQQQVEELILQLGNTVSEKLGGRNIADKLVKEVSRYVASEQQLWPLLEDTSQDAQPGLGGLTMRSLKRNDDILELTSQAADALIAGRKVAESYHEDVLQIFNAEREDVDLTIKPLLGKAEVKYLQHRTQALYPSDNLDVHMADNSFDERQDYNFGLNEE